MEIGQLENADAVQPAVQARNGQFDRVRLEPERFYVPAITEPRPALTEKTADLAALQQVSP